MSFRNFTIVCTAAAGISLASGCSSSELMQPPPTEVIAGMIEITVATTGVAIDSAGYNLRLDGSSLGSGIDVQPNGSATFSVPAGNYSPKLFGVAPNCDLVTRMPAKLPVIAGETTALVLNVLCAAPTTLAFVRAVNSRGDEAIYTVNSDGTNESLIPGQSGSNNDPEWSPDGKRIAFVSTRDGSAQIYLMGADGDGVIRLTTREGVGIGPTNLSPAWSPDGSRIAFVSDRDGHAEIYAMNSDGTDAVRLTVSKSWNGDPAWSPDGSRIAFASERTGASAIWVMNADGTGLRQVTTPVVSESRPAWSPDGSKIAFSEALGSSLSGSYAEVIALINADGSGLTILTPAFDEASEPSWVLGGNKIAFTAADYSSPYVATVGLDGVNGSLSLSKSASHPVWRPPSR